MTFSTSLNRLDEKSQITLAKRSWLWNVSCPAIALAYPAVQLVSVLGAPPLIISRITLDKSLTSIESITMCLNIPGAALLANPAALQAENRFMTKFVSDSNVLSALAFYEANVAYNIPPPSWNQMRSYQIDGLSVNGIVDFNDAPIILQDGASIGFISTSQGQRFRAFFEFETFNNAINTTTL